MKTILRSRCPTCRILNVVPDKTSPHICKRCSNTFTPKFFRKVGGITHFCDCGKNASVTRNNAHICADCDALERSGIDYTKPFAGIPFHALMTLPLHLEGFI